MDKKFAYADDTDKSYGIAGMIISLNIAEAEDALDYASLDDPQSLRLSSHYTVVPVPGASIADSWHRMVARYRLMVNLLVSNVICRTCTYRREPIKRSVYDDLRSLIAEEGHSFCSLDDDEIDTIYNKVVNDAGRIFTSPRVSDIARRYSASLLQRRRVSHSEAFELLQSLL